MECGTRYISRLSWTIGSCKKNHLGVNWLRTQYHCTGSFDNEELQALLIEQNIKIKEINDKKFVFDIFSDNFRLDDILNALESKRRFLLTSGIALTNPACWCMAVRLWMLLSFLLPVPRKTVQEPEIRRCIRRRRGISGIMGWRFTPEWMQELGKLHTVALPRTWTGSMFCSGVPTCWCASEPGAPNSSGINKLRLQQDNYAHLRVIPGSVKNFL